MLLFALWYRNFSHIARTQKGWDFKSRAADFFSIFLFPSYKVVGTIWRASNNKFRTYKV